MNAVSKLLELADRGDTEAGEQWLQKTYAELRQIAGRLMANERAGNTLQATALVHEAYMRVLGPDGDEVKWNSPGHFFSAVAKAMRRTLIDRARRKKAQKRGAGAEHTAWDESRIAGETAPDELIALDEALRKLEAEDSALAEIVNLRYFVGMSVPETAAILEISPRSVNRQWECARAWLFREISEMK